MIKSSGSVPGEFRVRIPSSCEGEFDVPKNEQKIPKVSVMIGKMKKIRNQRSQL